MTAFESARYDDYLQRTQCRGETLTAREQRDFNSLDFEARKEWENAPRSKAYGGDFADVF